MILPLFFTIWDTAEYSLIVISLCLCIYQLYSGIKSYNQSIYKNDTSAVNKYLLSKIFYVFFNVFRILLQTKSFSNNFEESLANLKFFLVLFEAIWTSYDFYLILILYIFYDRIKKGFYGLNGMNQIGHQERELISKLQTAIIIECKGFKEKSNKKKNKGFLCLKMLKCIFFRKV